MDNPDGIGTGESSDAQDYYSAVGDVDVYRSFRCMDNPSNLDGLMQSVQTYASRNFVVDFSDDTAWAGFDLEPKGMLALLDSERPECLNTRWINVWYPFQHRPLLEELARRYDFSPRLLALMASDPKQPHYCKSPTTLAKQVRRGSIWGRKLVTFEMSDQDSEHFKHDELSEHSSISSNSSSTRGNLYRIAEDIWHYSSVDFGRNYVCVGYNSLYGNKTPTSANASSTDNDIDNAYLPYCTRVWTWLVLCEDNTVISIHEDPFPYSNGTHTAFQRRILAETRRNLVNVFRSLSTVSSVPLLAHNPLTLLPIRTRLGDTPEESAHRDRDAPGLLFYYLFENWHNSYTLVTRKESRYGVELTNLRQSMFRQPTLEHIDRLDRIGKELGVLRRHYESYDRLIDRLLEPQIPTAASLQNSQVVGGSESDSASMNTIRPGPNGIGVGVIVHNDAHTHAEFKDTTVGVPLSSAARVRFKRLRDLIDLYALSEVEEYLKQKESLVAMNFSLIAIKQSLDVDRLTRITLLLTKATILFLPVSFMTGYFSVPLGGGGSDGNAGEGGQGGGSGGGNVTYSVKTFWISFAVIFSISYLALFLFGVMNGNVQTLKVVEGMWKSIGWSWTKVMAMHRRKRANRKGL